MIRTLLLLGWLTAVWIALWGELTWANVLSGLVVSAIAVAVAPLHRPSMLIRFRPHMALALGAYFLWQLVRASAEVAWEVLTPQDRTSLGVFDVPMKTSSEGIVTLVANMVSLTPGTLTLEASTDPPLLLVHALHVHDSQAARESVSRLERLALRAFPELESAKPSDGTSPGPEQHRSAT